VVWQGKGGLNPALPYADEWVKNIIAGMPASMGSRGRYFAKKRYRPEPLPTYRRNRSRLPAPILDANPEWVAMYWRAWELAFDHLKKPPKGSPLVSNFLDEAFNEYIFQWDTIFMVMFGRYMHKVFPAIQSLDNFYCRQHDDGVIWRVLTEEHGADHEWASGTRKINPPLFSWAEVESFKLTGDKERFAMVLPVLERYLGWLERHRQCLHTPHRLYWSNGLASGMDNTPRDAGRQGGNSSGDETGYVDMSCQMVIQYENLAVMCDELGKSGRAVELRARAREIGARINRWCWNERDGLYYDVDPKGRQRRIKSIACFWPLLAGVASPEQAERLVKNLKDKRTFWRKMPFPSVSADHPDYDPGGKYWRGGVWAPTNLAAIKGLEKYGYEDFASAATARYLRGLSTVFRKTNTLWEMYAPDSYRPGTVVDGKEIARKDFVGWTGCGPVALLIENILGFRADGVNHRLTWRISRTDRHGIRELRVGDATVSLVCGKRKSKSSPVRIRVEVNKPVELVIVLPGWVERFRLKRGKCVLSVRG